MALRLSFLMCVCAGVDGLLTPLNISDCFRGRVLFLTKPGTALGLVNPGFDQAGRRYIAVLIADLTWSVRIGSGAGFRHKALPACPSELRVLRCCLSGAGAVKYRW